MIQVTPLVGVWIEINYRKLSPYSCMVTPLVGVWIEIVLVVCGVLVSCVTPLVGVWIEMFEFQFIRKRFNCHSPCGSVD